MPKTRRLPVRSKPPAEYLLGEPMRLPQRNYIELLLAEKDANQLPDSASVLLVNYRTERLDTDGASDLIDALKDLPRVYRGGRATGRAADLPDIPTGRYCVFGRHSKAEFYRVRYGAGREEGWLYLDVQASDDFYPITNLRRARRILEAIANDPRRAAERYAHLLGRCFECGQTLTNSVSRKVGCCPVCAEKTGWYDKRILARLREAGK